MIFKKYVKRNSNSKTKEKPKLRKSKNIKMLNKLKHLNRYWFNKKIIASKSEKKKNGGGAGNDEKEFLKVTVWLQNQQNPDSTITYQNGHC